MSLQELFDDKRLETKPISEQGKKQLLLLAKMGIAKEALLPMVQLATENALHHDHQRFFIAPIVQHQSQWQDTTPAWMYEAITYDRLELILDEHKKGIVGWQVGAIELLTVMYPATFEAPLNYEAAQVYFWAASKACAYHYQKSEDFYWEQIGGRKVEDKEVVQSGGTFHFFYQNLCTEIRRKVVKAGKERESTYRKQTLSVPKNNPPSSNLGIQLDLF